MHCSVVISESDCRSRGREIDPVPVSYFCGDWSWNNFYRHWFKKGCCQLQVKGAQWLSGRVLNLRPRVCRFEPHRRHCVVSLSKNINPSLVLALPRKTHLFITERLLMGHEESNQTKTKSYKWKYVHKLLASLLRKKSEVRWTDRLDMTIAADWDVKPLTKQIKQNKYHQSFKQFGFSSNPTFCWPRYGSKL